MSKIAVGYVDQSKAEPSWPEEIEKSLHRALIIFPSSDRIRTDSRLDGYQKVRLDGRFDPHVGEDFVFFRPRREIAGLKSVWFQTRPSVGSWF